MTSAPQADGAVVAGAPRGKDARVPWIVALLCAPVVVGLLLALNGYSWEAVLLCTFATGAVVPVALPWLAQRPFDLFHPMAWITLSVLLGTTLRSLYVSVMETANVHWLLENQTLESILPGDVRLVALTLDYGERLVLGMQLAARHAASYDQFLQGLQQSALFADVRPGEEIRDGGVRAQVQATYRVGR